MNSYIPSSLINPVRKQVKNLDLLSMGVLSQKNHNHNNLNHYIDKKTFVKTAPRSRDISPKKETIIVKYDNSKLNLNHIMKEKSPG